MTIKIEELAGHRREQLLFLRAENAQLKGKIAHLDRLAGERKELSETIRRAIETVEPLRPVPYRAPRKLHADLEMAAVVKLSDWHIGEIIRPEETEEFGHFNWATAQARVRELAQKIIGWTQTHRLAFKIPRLHVFGEADWVSGNIHDELTITNEFPAPVAAVRAGFLLADFIATVAPHFPEILVEAVGADNHGRLTRKPQAKQKAANNWSFVVYAVARERLARHGNVRWKQPEAMTDLVSVEGVKFLVSHGDAIRAWMGVPYYGMARHKGREAVRRMLVRKRREIGFDYISYGHWHVPGIIEGNILVNGSLNGTSEYDHQNGRHAAPAQVSFLVHPRYGLFDWTPWQPKQ